MCVRVGLFTEAYHPVANGVVTSTDSLAQGLRAGGHHVTIFAPAYPNWTDEDPDVVRLGSWTLPAAGGIPCSLPFAPELAHLVAGRRLDVLHTQHPFNLGRLARARARAQGLPLVCTIHTQYEHYVHYCSVLPGPMAQRLVRRSIRRFCNTCDRVVTPARGMREILRGYGVRAPISVVPNGLDLAPFQCANGAAVRRRHAIPAGAPLLLSVGRLAREKNLGLLLDAVQRIRPARPEVHLLIVGEGPERPALAARLAAMEFDPGRVLAGLVDHDAIPDYYAAADFCLVTSVTEVNPMVLLESMASGTPVVAVDSFSAREIIRDQEDGCIVPANMGCLSAAVLKFLGNTQAMSNMSRAARAAAQRFSQDVCARRMAAIYEELASRPARSLTRAGRHAL